LARCDGEVEEAVLLLDLAIEGIEPLVVVDLRAQDLLEVGSTVTALVSLVSRKLVTASAVLRAMRVSLSAEGGSRGQTPLMRLPGSVVHLL